MPSDKIGLAVGSVAEISASRLLLGALGLVKGAEMPLWN